MRATDAAPQVPYLPGVDGLRALAVVAVVLYHADVSWLPAGFLGVDVFFAISGYLIASLLLGEHASTGRIAVGAFWLRRARRLMPALFALLAGVTVASLAFARDAGGRLVGDLPAAAGYASNWWQIVRGESYFESIGRPPLLRHLWSLAVEEQFYVLAPLLLALVLRRGLRRSRLALACAIGAGLSAVWLAVLWTPGDNIRAYLGTDTRAAPLLLGIALAAVWRPARLAPEVPRGGRWVLDLVGLAALLGLLGMAMATDDLGATLFRGGFLLAAALATVAVAVAAHPATRVSRVLGRRPLLWLGTRSYGIYLWHWPVIALTRPRLDVPLHGIPLLVLRGVLSVALAAASYRWVEQPFRDGRAQLAFQAMRAPQRRRITALVAGGAVAGWLGVALSTAPVHDLSLVSVEGSVTTLATWPSSTRPPSTSTTAAPTTAVVDPTAPPTTAAPTTAPPPPPPAALPVPAGPVLAVGDSVLLAARPALEWSSGGMVQVDAAVGRQVWDVLDLLERYRAEGALGRLSALVLHLGTNGPLSAGDFDRLAAAVEGVPRVLVLTVRVPRRWEETSNASVRDGVPRRPAMRLVDWHAASGEPGMLTDDGVHPSRAGIERYAAIVLAQLDGLTPPAPPETTTTTTETTTTTTTAPPPPPPTDTTTTTTTTTTAPPTTLVPPPP